MDYPLLDLPLARRIELAEADAAVSGAEFLQQSQPHLDAEVKNIAGGFAIFCGAGSPVTQALAFGLHGPVTKDEFDELEDFYFHRNEPVRIETCPMADPSLLEFYADRHYHVTEFSNVMARPVEPSTAAPTTPDIDIRPGLKEELDLWTLAVSQGFAEQFPVTQELLNVMKMFASARGMERYLARINGRVVGGAALSLRGKTAGFFGASTLPDFRNRGVQTALLHYRMNRAAQAGCDLAVSLAVPGSHSQRNITRLGFRTLYTRAKFERPPLPA
jgi:GNAT superfamily N-acetyltransferase